MASDNARAGMLGYYYDTDNLVLVEMGETRMADFSQCRAIATHGLGACSVVLVVSPYAAILAHIPPLPGYSISDPFAGDNHARAMMAELTGIYQSYANYFPAANSHIVCAVYDGAVGLPHQLAIMQEAFRAMGLEAEVHYYDVPVDHSAVGEGTVVVISPELGMAPSVYVQDELIVR